MAKTERSEGRPTKRKRKSSLLRRIIVPMIGLALVQVCVFGAVLAYNGGFSYIRGYAYRMLLEKTENRASYVENMLTQKTSLAYETSQEIGEAVEGVLAEYGVSAEAVQTDKTVNTAILSACADSLTTLIRRDQVNDAFLILDSGTLYDAGGKSLRPGLYFRDTDVSENSTADNKDIFMEMGNSQIARSLSLALDTGWSLYLDVTDRESGDYDFFYEPIAACAENEDALPYNLGYWSGLSAIISTQEGSIRYTLPLKAEDGTVYGVMGIGLLPKTIEQSIPSQDFQSESTCYILGADFEGSGVYAPMLHRGSVYSRIVTEDTVLSKENSGEYSLYRFGHAGGVDVVGSIQTLSLYSAGSPWRSEKWALISAADEEMICAQYTALLRTLFASMAVTLSVSVILAMFLSGNISRPVERMAAALKKRDEEDGPVTFQPSGIREIDVLADAVEDLQVGLQEYASRVSRIMTLSGSRIGVFLYDGRAGKVFVGESLIKLLHFHDLPERDVTIDLEAFRRQLSFVDAKGTILGLPVFAGTEEGPASVTREISCREPDGKTVWYKFSLTRNNTGVIGLVQDITDTTDKLIEANEALKEACEAAEKANHTKTDFLSRMSHDIRTPMNAIMGMTVIAENHLDDPEKLAGCFEKIRASSDYLLALINEVLDMSKIEAGKFVLASEEINLRELVDMLLEMVQSSIQEKGHTMTVEISRLAHENVISDSLRLQQIFMNIMSNAVKYTPPGGHLFFGLSERTMEDTGVGCYEFVFRDDGIGMAPEFLANLFVPFEREEDVRVSKEQGTGLGMTITYNIVKRMNGEIEVESAVDQGTTFTVTLSLPLSQKEAALSEETKPDASGEERLEEDFSGHRILLVDDNELNLEIAAELLGMMQLTVETAGDGREAVERFAASEEGYYDMVFMDVQMPVMNGYEATRAIRALNRADAQTVPIAAMTANAFAEDIRDAQEAGMDEHISKPLDLDKLIRMLNRRLSAKGKEEGKGK